MQNTIIYLIGNFGVGKLTVARALCEMTDARLFDNHLVNNVVFSQIRVDGKTPMPPKVWDYIERIRTIAVEALAELASPAQSFVFTNALIDDPADRRVFNQVLELARARQALFVPVMLDCSEEENRKRVADPARETMLKQTDAEAAIVRRREVSLLPVDHPNRLDLDTTELSANEAAARILAHMEGLTT